MASYRVDVEDFGLASRVERAAAMLDADLQRELQGLGDDAEIIFAAHAPRRSGRLARGIVARGGGGGVLVTAHARNPRSGYDYVGVTRFGHRVARIRPRRARVLGPIPGIGFRASVRGYHPAGDWADRALPAVQLAAEVAAARLGRRIIARIG